MKKKVLMLLTNSFHPDPRVYKEAFTLVNNGYEVDIYCLDSSHYGKNECSENINIFRIEVGKYKLRSPVNRFLKMNVFKKKILNILKENKMKYDIIHAHDFDTLLLAASLKKKLNAKLIFDSHELVFGYKGIVNFFVNIVISFFVSYKKNMIDHFIIPSYERLILFSERFGLNFNQISVINNYPTIKEDFKKKKNDLLIFQYQGIIDVKRNLLNVIKAVGKLSEEKKKLMKLILYGNDKNKYTYFLKEQIKKLNLSNVIEFRGFLKYDLLIEETKKTDVGLVPIQMSHLNNRYPAPNKLYDYISRKNIVLSQDTFGLSRNVKENNLGFCCDFENIDDIVEKINIILNISTQELDTQKESVYRKHIEKFNWEGDKLLAIYSNLSKNTKI